MIWGFFDASHANCLVTRRSTSCVILFINGTPIKFFSKRQNTVKTSTFGSEFVPGRIAVDLTVELRYNLRILGMEVKGLTTLFGDNQSMIINIPLPYPTLKKHQCANNYNHSCEFIASDIVSIVHYNTTYNLVDIGTEALPGPTQQFILQDTKPSPISTVRECQTGNSTSLAHNTRVLSYMEYNALCAFSDINYWSHLTKFCS